MRKYIPIKEQLKSDGLDNEKEKEDRITSETNRPIRDAITKLKNEIDNNEIDLKHLNKSDENYIQKRQELYDRIKAQKEALQKLQDTLEKEE